MIGDRVHQRWGWIRRSDGDGNVGITDFLQLLAAWGPC